MGKQNRRIIGPKRKKKVKIPSQFVELPPFEHAGFDVPTGLQKVANLLKSTSEEVRENILCDCKVIYECKCCREMFRDAIEFINHKREDCKARHATLTTVGPLTRSRARTSTPSTSQSRTMETIVDNSN